MNTNPDRSTTEITKALTVWANCLADHPFHQRIPHELIFALSKDEDHYRATVRWLMDTEMQTFLEAIAVARARGILRSWEDVEAATV